MPLPSYIQAVIWRELRPNGIAQSIAKVVVLAEEVIRRGVAAFDGAVLHAVEHAEGRHQFAGGVHVTVNLPPVAADTCLANTSAAP